MRCSRYTYIFVYIIELIFVKFRTPLGDRRPCLILKFIIVRSVFSETVCRYFFRYVQGKIAACLKGKSTVFLKWDGVREWFDKVEKGINERKGGKEGKLLGKVTVIRRAHRVISHKATEACTSPSPKLSAKYILPPPVSASMPLPAFLLIVYTLSNLSTADYNNFHFLLQSFFSFIFNFTVLL